MRKWFGLALVAIAVGLPAGCGDDDDDDDASAGAETAQKTAPEAGGGNPAPSDNAKVSLKGIAFVPSEVILKPGRTITWTNDESVPHDVTLSVGPGAKFSSGKGNMKKGDTYKHTFKQVGRYQIICTIHPNMEQDVFVE